MSDPVNLSSRHCKSCEGGTPTLPQNEIREFLERLPGWASDGRAIARTFTFKNHYETMAFVNAVAFVSHREDHHPVMEVGYKTCAVRYTTHAAGGLTENDFICAAKVDALLAG